MSMEKPEIQRAVLTELARRGLSRFVPAGISARHVHLAEADIEVLFGKGYHLHPIRPLSQPGQFAAREQVTVIGPRGRLEHVRVLGPARRESQVEISCSDTFVLGAKNCPVRLSGDLKGSPGVKLLGPEGQVELKQGLIVAARHLHMNEEQAGAFGIHDGQVVSVKITGARPCILDQVICRTGRGHELELHLDTDEANACALGNGDLVEVLVPGRKEAASEGAGEPEPAPVPQVPEEEILDLVTERDINDAFRDNKPRVYCGKRALITPAATDRAKAAGIQIIRMKGGD